MFFIMSFYLAGERPFDFVMFSIIIIFFPWTAFIFQEILKHFFLNVADHLPFKVMAPNNPLPNNTKNLQSNCTLCIK